MHRAAVVLADFMEQRRRRFRKLHVDDPILLCYSSDATSLLCISTSTAKADDNLVFRKGKVLHEMSLQRLTYIAFSPVGRDIAHMIYPPRSLDSGKSAWHHWTACCDSMPLPFVDCHRSVFIIHYSFDRAVHNGLVKKLIARHEAFWDETFATKSPATSSTSCSIGPSGPLVCSMTHRTR